MSKWRPMALNAIYVIPDVQGAYDLLQHACRRILPLRHSDGGKDMLVFLGDYIDRHVDSHKVLDFLIDLKKQYPDQIVFLKGNHEQIFLSVMNLEPNKNLILSSLNHFHKMWLDNGGTETLAGYMIRAGMTDDVLPGNLPRFRISSLVPKEHIKFLQEDLVDYFELDNFIFVHGGCEPAQPLNKQDPNIFYWDRSLVNYVENSIRNNKPNDIFWEKTIVTGHNNKGGTPIVHPKFLMLDCGSPKRLLITEVKSMNAFMVYPGQSRMVKLAMEPTVLKKYCSTQPIIKRS